MQRHKIVAPIVLLILSVINFALTAPVSLERGIREVRMDVVDVAEDSDNWITKALVAIG
jgi:hypothetical protein